MNIITNKLIIISTVIIVSTIGYGISEYVRIENAKTEIVAKKDKDLKDRRAADKEMLNKPFNYSW